jgi:hypothetical protein
MMQLCYAAAVSWALIIQSPPSPERTVCLATESLCRAAQMGVEMAGGNAECFAQQASPGYNFSLPAAPPEDKP